MKVVASIALVAAQLLFMVGCQSLPSVTQSGDIKEIFVSDLSLAEVSVNAGDEVRWINKRMTSISIVFPQPVHAKLSCRNNFGGFYTGGIETTLGPDELASLCFHTPVSFQYVVRMQSALEDGKVNITGAIRVDESLDKHIVQKLSDTMTTDNRTQP